jgi:uncharacterized protein (UPF0335 family)
MRQVDFYQHLLYWLKWVGRDVLLLCVCVSASQLVLCYFDVEDEESVIMHSGDVNKLKQYIDKIENLENEKTEIQEQISDVFGQAKSDGFDTKIMKKVLKLKKMRTEDRENEDLLLDTYMVALGLAPTADDEAN